MCACVRVCVRVCVHTPYSTTHEMPPTRSPTRAGPAEPGRAGGGHKALAWDRWWSANDPPEELLQPVRLSRVEGPRATLRPFTVGYRRRFVGRPPLSPPGRAGPGPRSHGQTWRRGRAGPSELGQMFANSPNKHSHRCSLGLPTRR